jgi:hypothetical protein
MHPEKEETWNHPWYCEIENALFALSATISNQKCKVLTFSFKCLILPVIALLPIKLKTKVVGWWYYFHSRERSFSIVVTKISSGRVIFSTCASRNFIKSISLKAF